MFLQTLFTGLSNMSTKIAINVLLFKNTCYMCYYTPRSDIYMMLQIITDIVFGKFLTVTERKRPTYFKRTKDFLPTLLYNIFFYYIYISMCGLLTLSHHTLFQFPKAHCSVTILNRFTLRCLRVELDAYLAHFVSMKLSKSHTTVSFEHFVDNYINLYKKMYPSLLSMHV